MPLIYITGSSGAGKSTIRKELQKRGYEAHDTDEDGFSGWVNNQTKLAVKFPPDSTRPQGWLEEHAYTLSAEKITELVERAKNKKIFLCGIPANDIDFFEVFDKIIFLEIDKKTMLHRIKNRENNSFGQSEDSLALILKWFDAIRERYEKAGAVFIDATKPIEDVTQEVINNS
jgi:dephospho-CoA kinase